jgi:hypothetical protein
MHDERLKNYRDGKLLPKNMIVLYPLGTDTMQTVAVLKPWVLVSHGKLQNVVALNFGGKPSKT